MIECGARLVTVGWIAITVGCSCSPDAADERDARILADAGPGRTDASAIDSGGVDSGRYDSGSSDSGNSDSGERDASSPDAHISLPPITDPESALVADLTARCTQLLRCCTAADLGLDTFESVDVCVAELFSSGYLLIDEASALAAAADADIAAGRTRFDVDAAASCVERFAAMSCGEVRLWRHEFYRPHRYGHLCAEMFEGLLPDLSPCDFDHQCAGGACFSRGPAKSTDIVCGTLPGESEPCFGRCGFDLSCVGSTPGDPGTCMPNGRTGDGCEGERVCGMGLRCVAGVCAEDTRCDGVP